MDVLSIPTVLETIFRKLDKKSLLECRLVSKTWNCEACNILRNQVTVVFDMTSKLIKYNETFNQSSSNDLAVSFRQFHFSNDLFRYAVMMEWKDLGDDGGHLPVLREELEKFAEFSGEQVTSLKLDVNPSDCCVRQVEERRQQRMRCYASVVYPGMVEMVWNWFPNLQKFHLSFEQNLYVRDLDHQNNADILMAFQTRLAGYAGKDLENLQSLHLDLDFKGPSDSDDPDRSNLLGVQVISLFLKTVITAAAANLRTISSSRGTNLDSHVPLQNVIIRTLGSIVSPRLKEISLPFQIHSEHLDILGGGTPSTSTTSLSLRTVHLSMEEMSSGTVSSLLNFFQRCCSSLHQVHLSFKDKPSQGLSLPVVVLQNLKSLTLSRFHGFMEWSSVAASLEELTLDQCSFQTISWRVNPLLLPHLTLLTVTNSPTGGVPLTAIFCGCRNLRSLHVSNGRGVSDQVLVGIKGELEDLLCVSFGVEVIPLRGFSEGVLLQRIFKRLVEIARDPATVPDRDLPFIGNLKELESLTLLDGDFSDVAVLHGIIHCRKLKEVKLESDKMTHWRHILRQAELENLVAVNDSTL